MKLKLILATAILVAALALPGSAWAQAPPNDTFDQATVIPSLPFSQVLDTTQATVDSTDVEALAACGLTGNITGGATVWYEYTPPVDQSLLITTAGTSYVFETGVAVLTGSPGNLSEVTCFADNGGFLATAGVSYHILVADIAAGGIGGTGGTLHLSVETPGVGIKVDRFGRFDPKTGVATVTGTFTCPNTSGLVGSIGGELSQRANDRVVGPNIDNISCTGATQPWSMTFTPSGGNFTGGPADVTMGYTVIGFPFGGLGDTVNQRVILRGG
jgi:hypothetical protein